MNILINTLAVIGAICVVSFLVVIILNAVDEAAEKKRGKKYYEKGREVAGRLDIAHWFSKHPEVYNALDLLHYQLKKYGHVDADRIRTFIRICGDKRWRDLPKEKTDEFFM